MKINGFTKKIKQESLRIAFSSKRLLWLYILLQSIIYKKRLPKHNNRYHKKKNKYTVNNKKVVFMCDATSASGGLVDRLRAIVSIYKTCRDLNLELRILFTEPFNLNEYLQPNKVQWETDAEELNYNLKTTDICFISTPTREKWLADMQEQWFKKEFKKNYHEFHVISNTSYSYNYDFATLFSELFKPSPHLQSLINTQKRIIGNNYISVSCRFRDLLGDFNETCPLNLNLSIKEKEELIIKNVKQIEILHNKFPDKKILVNSDSTRFLNAAKEKEYTYVIPGEIGHIDSKEVNHTEIHDKTFTDFFMIAHAEHIYLLQTGLMFESGFPWAASLIYNRPYTRIEF